MVNQIQIYKSKSWHALVQFQEEMMAVRKIIQNPPLSHLLFVNGLPSLPCDEPFTHQQFRWQMFQTLLLSIMCFCSGPLQRHIIYSTSGVVLLPHLSNESVFRSQITTAYRAAIQTLMEVTI